MTVSTSTHVSANGPVFFLLMAKLKKKKKIRASLVAQLVKQCGRPEFDPWVGKIPLEKGTATHSRILACRIPQGHKESDTTEWLSHTHKGKKPSSQQLQWHLESCPYSEANFPIIVSVDLGKIEQEVEEKEEREKRRHLLLKNRTSPPNQKGFFVFFFFPNCKTNKIQGSIIDGLF